MSSYWINLVECQRIVNTINDKLEDVWTDFDKTADNLEGIRASLCAPEESIHQENQARDVDGAITTFVDENLREHLDGIVSEIRVKVNAMQDVINYYASGDAEMAHAAAGTEGQMPEFVYTEPGTNNGPSSGSGSGYVPGHPARGNTEHHEYTPGHPATGLAGNSGDPSPADNVLSEHYATTSPYADAEASSN